jgi:23S rRNA pseudouridine1911/1915/1917 synthase
MAYRLLIIPGDNADLRALSSQLAEDVEVQVLDSANDALWEVRNSPPEAIVADMELPGMSGMDLAEILPNFGVPTRVVLWSRAPNHKAAEQAASHGVHTFLNGPLSSSQLHDAVYHALGRGEEAASAPVAAPEPAAVPEAPAPPPVAAHLVPEDIPLDVLYEDEDLGVINKPAGMVVPPGAGVREGTLVHALLSRWPQLAGVGGVGGVARPGIVHRLDKDTTGLLVVAKTTIAQTALVRQLQARSVHREYLALAAGDIARGGTIDAPIGRHPVKRTSMAVVATGKPSVTRYEVRERLGDCTLLACRLESGRTHQIRVHLASIGHPLVGDAAYGRAHETGIAFARQALHAWKLGLLHPVTQEHMQWESPLPADFAALLSTLGQRRPATRVR